VAAIPALRLRPIGIVPNLCSAVRTRPARRGTMPPRPWKNGLRDHASRSGPRPSWIRGAVGCVGRGAASRAQPGSAQNASAVWSGGFSSLSDRSRRGAIRVTSFVERRLSLASSRPLLAQDRRCAQGLTTWCERRSTIFVRDYVRRLAQKKRKRKRRQASRRRVVPALADILQPRPLFLMTIARSQPDHIAARLDVR
jgi:hypothetical protein